MARPVAGSKLTQRHRGLFTLAWLAAAPYAVTAVAADNPPPPKASASEPLETIVVTGSYLRRTDSESPSPVTVIGAEQITKSGFNSIADVIRSASSDNSGTLSQNFSGAMAGGANGVSLRGLSVDATLVLVDGHRMAPYPLADDGQRPFVDIASLPLGMVERVEVLKDGASALYGSDAIAGVVNVILKKQFTGVEITGGLGSSYKGDGLSQRFSATFGTGTLAENGRNVYFNLEYRHSAEISQKARGSYLDQLDLTSYGGPDLRGGVAGNLPFDGSAYTVPGQVAPVSGGVQLDPRYYLLPGCSPQNYIDPQQCTWDTNVNKKIQPRTEGINFSGRWTQKMAGDWQNSLTASYFISKSEQYRQSNLYNAPVTLVPFAWGGSKVVSVNQFDPSTTQIVLPANHPDNPFNPASPYFAGAQNFYGADYSGSSALFYGALTDMPPQHALYNTGVLRLVNDVTGTVAGWDVTGSVGYVRTATRVTYQGFVRYSALAAALADGSYRVGQNAHLNSPALYAKLAPETNDTATSSLAYLSLNGSHSLMSLPGGDMAIATGVEARFQKLDNPGEPYAPQGGIIMDGSFYARGSQTVYAAFAELSAPVLHSLELSAAGRLDHYNSTGFSFTPKVGFKWKIVPQIALRGTFARGFRAPSVAESGDAGVGTSVAPAFADSQRCPVTGSVLDCGLPGSSVAIISRSNPNLQPEKSRSYTVGLIIEPIRSVTLTIDYFNIRRDNEITSAPFDDPRTTIVRGPDQGNLPGTIVAYIEPYVNASYSLTSGIDAELKTSWSLGEYGTLSTRAEATNLIQQQQTVGDQTFHYVGTVGPTALSGSTGTPSTRGSFNLDWTIGRLSLGTTFTYHSAMRGVDESVDPTACLQLSPHNPHCYVAGFGYADVYGQYQWNDHLQMTGTITNITNRLAPLNNVTYGGQNYNPSLDQAGAVGRFFELAFRYRL